MVEKPTNSSELPVPQRWHDAIRASFEGTQSVEGKFMSFPINEPNGLTYSILSLTSDNQKRGTKAGVYVETNITPLGADVWQRYAAPMMLKLTVLFSQRAATSADVDPVPVTFDADLTGMGGEIDFGNTVEFIPLAYTGNQGLVIKVVPADPARGRNRYEEQLRSGARPSITRLSN